jgi:hypothetical protein
MWNEWNRWWNARDEAGDGPPEETESPSSKSETDPGVSDEPGTAQSETSLDVLQARATAESESAAASIPETVQPVEQTIESANPAEVRKRSVDLCLSARTSDRSTAETAEVLDLSPRT